MSSVAQPQAGKPQGGPQGGRVTNGATAAERDGSKTQRKQTHEQKQSRKASDGEKWTLSMFRQASRRPLPTEMGDGSYRVVAKRTTLLQDLRSIGWGDIKTLKDVAMSKIKGEKQADDKKMLMERVIQLVATMPNHSSRQEALTNNFIDQLWDSLDHPPLLYMGNEFRFRQPDGSNNNPTLPRLGAAGTPYSRTVKPGKHNHGALPDPELVYESVMARDGFKKNPNNVSSILWYWATIIIHDLFNTNLQDGNINESSSYLDLSPLYGSTQEAIDSIRTFKDGKIKADTFADRRLIGNPPGVCILLIMFNRFHNHIAESLAAINENNRFPKPGSELSQDEAAGAWAKYDEELFQTARLVTSGLYINITLIDYVRNIINLNRVDTEWTLDPRQEMGVSVGTSKGAESGVGNAVSAEFNLCYRWHSCISEMDEVWIQDFYRELLGDDYGELGLPALMAAAKRFEMSVAADPAQRTFSGLKRQGDGRFSDDELAELLATAIEQPGGAFGARNVPRIMKPVEMLGILRGRRWKLAGLNEFRKHFGLQAYATFEAINSDPEVAEALRTLYVHPDHVELYPGIVAEEGKRPMVPGVGIAPTYTISRVVLSDAVALVRGDRYYTTDYHAGHLTQWGYNEANYDLCINHGCSFFKLFLTAFPRNFAPDSVYAHYPMVIPSENRHILNKLGRAHLFSFARPGASRRVVDVTSWTGVGHVLGAGLGHYSAVDVRQGLDELMGHCTTPNRRLLPEMLLAEDWQVPVKATYATLAEQLLTHKAHRVAGKPMFDVVRDLGNMAHTHFVARLFNLPLKTPANPRGVMSEHEVFDALCTLAALVGHELDPVRQFTLKKKARAMAAQLGGIVETNARLSSLLGMAGLFTPNQPKNDALARIGGPGLIKKLAKAGCSPHEIAWGQVLPTAARLVPALARQFAVAVAYFLSPAGEAHARDLHRLASQPSNAETDALLLGYALEGLRLAGGYSSLELRATASDTISSTSDDEGAPELATQADDLVRLLPCGVQGPDRVDARRPLDTYPAMPVGVGRVGREPGADKEHELYTQLGRMAMVELFRALFRRKGLRRVPGAQGELKRVPGPRGGVLFLSEDWGTTWPYPAALKVVWDAE
ncbi:hypothetical protein CDD81_7597 [Ophiocordyceps australis]|uniref:Linoleate 8R-lipoxygenase n=1 Tax=Ophiocordyceps australis TaxID=1399860 RepID=A0A2C5Y584_9HYPO|nr:hypothetical protein CDD81_7597 [Ophiocordyceps australis]